MKPLHWLASLAIAVSLPALAEISDADGGAMKKLAWANLHEIEAGKLAASKAQNPQVKQFGQKMADDHGQMLKDLQALASKKGVKLPDQLGMKEQADMVKLKALSGERFDKSYMSDMVKDHEKDVRETQEIADKAQDADFKAAVQKANAKIKEHLQEAQRVASSASSPSGSSGSSSAPK
jgi:putative membrane protein